MFTFNFKVPHEHPCLAGHFPGNPIVPGVIIINEIISALHSEQSEYKIEKISSIKFVMPLKADELVDVQLIEKKKGLISFECLVNNQVIVSGQACYQQVKNCE